MINRQNMCVFLALTILAAPLAVRAQTGAPAGSATPDSDQLALAAADAQKANMAGMMKYSWKVKTEIVKDGATQATSVSEMRFDTDGKLDATNLSSQSNVEKKPGLRGRRQEAAIDDFVAYLQKVLDQSSKYVFMSKGTLVDVFDRAKITQTEGAIDVAATGLFVKDDAIDMTLDPKTNLTQKLTFKTTVDGDPVSGVVTYAVMDKGPSRATGFTLDIPAKAVKLSAETFDWIKQE